MITLEHPNTKYVKTLYTYIDENREYYSTLVWAKSCTEESLLGFFGHKETTNDIIKFICLDNIPVGVIDGRVNADVIDIGFWIAKQYSSCGYTTSAVKIFLSGASARVFTARALITNIESNRVLEKVGFEKVREDNLFNYYNF
jgi:RimJ/RimL family protein N-acetyltransferase